MKALRLGVVGLGRGFMLTLPALRADGRLTVMAAFDLRQEALDAFAAEFGGAAYGRLDDLLADGNVDAVYIATPHELHAPQTIAALRAGKHVLVEKPMATSISDCAAMIEAADASGKLLMVGPSHGFDEPVRLAAELVASGRFGNVRMLTALNFTDFMYRPRRPEELGTGVVLSQAAHQIDVLRRLAGQPVSTIRAVAGSWDPKRGGDGAYAALMTFRGGATATLSYSGYAHYDSDELLGWVSELGRDKDPAHYGAARRTLAALPEGMEHAAKRARTYGSASGSADSPPPHHEHFGFVLVSCERADIRLLTNGVQVYGDEVREFIPIPRPAYPRAGVIEEFLSAIERPDEHHAHDGRWGLATMTCCAAISESSLSGTEIDLSEFTANLDGAKTI